ncbi:Muskelin [Hypsibius exemplaris]|uniref:Muskelin n=1 Tax=Hypsibius exemplaris TaxID=2072580 RepID=A0A9X6RMF2_HYPEX|nr:Muskelin [Hypsibius exemplaris]
MLSYKIHAASSFTENYPPQKILQNRPSDASCRWSSDSNSHPQFITLKLNTVSIVHQLTFGKYEKMHVCNIRKFQIYGGLDESGMLLLCEGDLRNDSIPETFNLKTMVGGKLFPINFLKIVPTQTWGSSFNYSIWYVELSGTDDERTVLPVLYTVASFRQETAFRMCLKMFRDMGLDECFETLQKNVPAVSLEHPFLTDLYDAVVKRGAFEEAEILIDKAAQNDFLKSITAEQKAVPVWTEILPGSGASPGMRGGHQMVLDSAAQMIYLYGGWDGARDLSDFWQYDLLRKKWILISTDTEQEDGPSARSCHKMVIDSDNQTIFVIGRFLDGPARTGEPLKNDFFMYDILRKRWTQLSSDTFAEGGPKVLYDHQVALDILKRTIYVFGGRVAQGKPPGSTAAVDNAATSGLYAYHIPTSTWRRIEPASGSPDSTALKPRMGHCIIFHPVKRLLYIVGGKYDKDPVKDMVAFHVDKETSHIVGSTASGDTMPIGLTQRATLDLDRDEIYVYFGFKSADSENRQNTLWTFDVATSKWSICPTKKTTTVDGSQPTEPSPRYAHQIVYDPTSKLHYLFGGSLSVPSSITSVKTRLDDFWQMELVQRQAADIARQAKYVIRKQKFRELCLEDPVTAVQYLQRDVSETIDSTDDVEMNEFHDLPTLLFSDTQAKTVEEQSGSRALTTQQSRVDVFSKLCNFFPEEMAPPRANLIDLVLP